MTVAEGQTNLDVLWAASRGEAPMPPAASLLGWQPLSLERGCVRVEYIAREEWYNPQGSVQGGFIAAMLDEAMSSTTIIASNVTMNAPTLEMKVSFLRPLFVGKATAEARILKWGRSTCFIEAELFDPQGQLVAKASATQAPKPFKRF